MNEVTERPKGFEVVELLNSTRKHVTWAYIPPFQTRPQVIFWGDRIFNDDDFKYVTIEDGTKRTILTYKEVFAVSAIYYSTGEYPLNAIQE